MNRLNTRRTSRRLLTELTLVALAATALIAVTGETVNADELPGAPIISRGGQVSVTLERSPEHPGTELWLVEPGPPTQLQAADEEIAEYIPPVTAGSELILALRKGDADARTGPATNSEDNQVHATVEIVEDREFDVWLRVRFELAVGDGDLSDDFDDGLVTLFLEKAPVTADAGPDQTVREGATVTLDGTASRDRAGAAGDAGALSYRWSVVDSTGDPVRLSSETASRPTFTVANSGLYRFKLTVNQDTSTSSDEVIVTVDNAAPTLTAQATAGPDGIGSVAATFGDRGVTDTHTATVTWGDGTPPEPVTVAQGPGWGALNHAHRYASPGTYTVAVTVTDSDGGTATATSSVIVASTTQVDPIALWAEASVAGSTLTIAGQGHQLSGRTQANAALVVTGSANSFTGNVGYVSGIDVGGLSNTITPPPVQGPPVPSPAPFTVADFQPGGSAAIAAGSAYQDLSAGCAGGPWTPQSRVAAGLYWVPCDVEISGVDRFAGPVTIVSTGRISIAGSSHRLAAHSGGVALATTTIGADAVTVTGTANDLAGRVHAPNGTARFTGTDQQTPCGVFAAQIRVEGIRHLVDPSRCPAPAQSGTDAAGDPVVVPTLTSTIATAADVVVPGQAVPYSVTVGTTGATVALPAVYLATNTGTVPATVDAVDAVLEAADLAGTWTVVASTSAGTVQLSATRAATAGVSGAGPLTGTVIDPGATALWGVTVQARLDTATVAALLDPARTGDLRIRLTAADPPGTLSQSTRNVSQPLASLRANGARTITTTAQATLPNSGTTTLTAGPLGPGDQQTFTVTDTLTVDQIGSDEEPASYAARLEQLDGALQFATLTVTGTAPAGVVYGTPASDTTTIAIPIVTATLTGPGGVGTGREAVWQLRLTNTGTATADPIQVSLAIGNSSATLQGLPATLAPGATSTGTASYTVPANQAAGQLTAVALTTWRAAGSPASYGPINNTSSAAVTTIGEPIPQPLVTISPVRGRFFPATAGATAFAATPATPPAFEQTFANLAFNRPGLTPAVNETTRPFTNVDVDPSANTVGTTVASGNGLQAGVGALANFQAAFTGTVTVAEPGDITFVVRANAGFVFGVGGGAARAGGELVNPPATTAFENLPVVGARNGTIGSAVGQYRVVVTFPAPGDYPFELDHFETNGGNLALALEAVQPERGSRALWLGNDHVFSVSQGLVGRVELMDLEGRLLLSFAEFHTGVATNAHNTFWTERDGTVQVRSLDGNTLLYSFPMPTGSTGFAEGLAWDSSRQALWRADDASFNLKLIDPVARSLLRTIPLPQTDPTGVWGEMRQLGVSYDESRDLLYVMQVAVPEGTGSRLITVDPDTGAVGDELFRVNDKTLYSVAWDPEDDTLWAGAYLNPRGYTTAKQKVIHYTRTGVEISRLQRNTTGVTDGLALTQIAQIVVAPRATLQLGPFTITGQTNTAHRYEALLLGPDGQPAAGATVNLTVTGANTASLVTQTDGDGIARFDYTPTNPGDDTLQATATIGTTAVTSNGARGTWTTPPGGGGGPGPNAGPGPIYGTALPAEGTIVTTPIAVTVPVTAQPGTTITTWTVTARPAGEPPAGNGTVTLATGTGAPPSPWGTLDPTVLDNGAWTIRFQATDSTTATTAAETGVIIDGQLKLGRLRVTYQDLNVNIGGIPIQVNRTYDTLDRNTVGEFGQGWSLEIANIKARSNGPIGRGGWEAVACGGSFFPKFCSRTTRPHFVTVAWPDGRTETFDARFEIPPFSTFLGTVSYQARAGSKDTTSKLEPIPDDRAILVFQGSVYEGGQFAVSPDKIYNPTRWLLTDKFGTRYVVDRDEGLIELTDRNANKLTVTEDGITHSSGTTVEFTRDSVGRITRIADPAGFGLDYRYDSAGDLVEVTDQSFHTTRFAYQAGHYLTGIDEPGPGPSRTYSYTADGRLNAVTDQNGHTTRIDVDVAAQTQTVTSADNRLVTVSTFDVRGNQLTEDAVFDNTSHPTAYTYDTEDRIASRTDALGHRWQAGYDTRGNMVRYEDPNNNVTTVTYNPFGQPLTVTDPAGGTTTAGYDSFGNLTRLVNPVGGESTFAYNIVGGMTRRTDETGRTWEYKTDLAARRREKTDPAGHTTFYDYDPDGRPSQTTDPLGNRTGWLYTSTGKLARAYDQLQNETRYDYDDRDQLIAVTDPSGAVTATSYDNVGNVISTTNPVGGVTVRTYDEMNRVTTETDPTGGTTTYTYTPDGLTETIVDPVGRTTSYGYDLARRHTTVTLPSGGIETTGYDPGGRAVSRIDAGGGAWATEYDQADRVESTTDPLGRITTHRYDLAGRRTSTTNPAGEQSTVVYDLSGRRTSQSNGAAETTTFTYDPVGRTSTVTDPTGATTRYGYDPAGRLTSVTDPNGHTSLTFRDERGLVTRTRSAGGVEQRRVLDSVGRVVESSVEIDVLDTPDGPVSVSATDTYSYDPAGRMLSHVDPNGHTTSYAHDLAGRRTRETDAAGGTVDFGYNPAGERTTVTDPNGATRTTAYTSLGDIASETDPIGRTTSWAYDPAGRILTKTDPRGFTIGYTHNPAGELTTISTPDGPVTYTYDPAGRQQTATNTAGTISYTYDPAGRPTAITSPSGNVAYTYDPAGRKTSLTAPTGVTRWRYDPAGNTIGVTPPGLAETVYEYDPDGRPTRITRPGGVATTNNTYDPAGRLTAIAHTGAQISESYAYTLDPAGNRTAVTSHAGAESYTLDSLNRLTGVTYPDGQTVTYTYDAAGNRTSETTTSGTIAYGYDSAGQLTSVTTPTGVETFTHDPSGNVVSTSTGNTFSYDWAGRLTVATINGVTTTSGYDAENTRIAVDGGSQVWDRSGIGHLVSDDGASVAHDPNGTGALVADGHYTLTDALGSTRTTIDPTTGTVTSTTSYDTYGTARTTTGTTPSFGYTGEQADPNGLTYLRARHYQPRTGRFLQPDTIQPNAPGTQGWNRWTYTANNPTTWTDPTGHDAVGYSQQTAQTNATFAQIAANNAMLAARMRAIVLIAEHPTAVAAATTVIGVLLVYAGLLIVGYVGQDDDDPTPTTQPPCTGCDPPTTTTTRPPSGPCDDAGPWPLFENIHPDDVPEHTQRISPAEALARSDTYIYVVQDGILKIGSRRAGHIDLADGRAVEAAGEFRTKGGKVVEVNNKSGHYCPSGPSAEAAARGAFDRKGIPLDGVPYTEVAS